MHNSTIDTESSCSQHSAANQDEFLSKKHSAQNDQMMHSDKKCYSKNKGLKRVPNILYKHLQHTTKYLN